MAYSKPERKKHRKPKKKPANPTVKLNKSSWKWANERGADAQFSQYMRDVREQTRTGSALERRKLRINKSNWKRYHGSREM